MPLNLFRSQSDEAKKRLQHQLYLAQENPEPHFDISGCQISEIPSIVFSHCRILNKEVLLLYDNWISNLEGNGKLSDLVSLRVLDLHKNELKSLPSDIGLLHNLQVLNVEDNYLKVLPDEISDLVNLQTLTIKKNNIKQLPNSICNLTRLRTLDISDNSITSLPSKLCLIRTMETLTLDVNHMHYPSQDICEQGTEEIMKTLCNGYGMKYQPPSNFVLDVLDTPKPMTSSWSNNSFKVRKEEVKLMETIEQHQAQVDKKHRERLEIEKILNDEQLAQTELASAISTNKKHLIESLAKDQEKLAQELVVISDRRAADHIKLISSIVEVEKSTDNLISQLIDINETARKTEQLLEAVEKERREKDDFFVVQWEEIQNLRTKDVLHAMEMMIRESGEFEHSRQIFTSDRDHAARRALEEETNSTNRQVEVLLHSKDENQKALVNSVAQEEELQRKAFEVLQLQKDMKHQRITSEIVLIEEQLAQLTQIERERRDLRAEAEMNILCDKRIALCAMLNQLMDEQDRRQGELKKRLTEMEEQKLDGQADYWMVQYQRLMDSKPQTLIDQERNLEISIVKILQKSGAEDYLPLFARHRITIETMIQLSEADMKQMGVHELGLRRAIKNHIDDYKSETKKLGYEDAGASGSKYKPHPFAPTAPLEEENVLVTPVAGFKALKRQQSITARGIHSECAICLDKESQILFLTCGHVCCCSECSQPLKECPLCRSTIVQRIRLNIAGV